MDQKIEIINHLKAIADPQLIEMRAKKYGIQSKNALGISMKQLNALRKEIKGSKELALALFESDIYEAKLLCAKMLKPSEVTESLAEAWLDHFDNWEICDTYCMGLFAKSSFAEQKIKAWAEYDQEFKKRAAFATLAAYCMANKKSDNAHFVQFFPLIEKHADDDRLYVKKAVNWALRSIGKRNKDLKKEALDFSSTLLMSNSITTQWIAKDAIKELENPSVRLSDYPRTIYRT